MKEEFESSLELSNSSFRPPPVSHLYPKMRKIIHLDMDAFYASVEQLDFPEYRGLPVVVGGTGNRGVVCTASYEARKFGIHSAMSIARARRLCPKAVYVAPRFERYQEISRGVREIMRGATDLIEPLSLDEAYLDVSVNKLGLEYASEVARDLRKRVKEEIGLSCSIGVAPNKVVAKIASDRRKPGGITVVPPEKVEDFLAVLPVRVIPGVGPVTAKKLGAMGINKIWELRELTPELLERCFGKSGLRLYNLSFGRDESPVRTVRKAKSISVESTFGEDLIGMEEAAEKLEILAERLEKRLKGRLPRTLTLKITYADFEKITRSVTVEDSIAERSRILGLARQLLVKTEVDSRAVRLLGLGGSNFGNVSAANMSGNLEKPVTFLLDFQTPSKSTHFLQ